MASPIPVPATVPIPAVRIRQSGSPGGDLEILGFRFGRTPVTRREYAAFLDSDEVKRAGTTPPPWWNAADFSAPEQPVVGVTWDEAAAYCEWLGRRAGGRWRLPSEAEWEHACSGGRFGVATPWGDAIPPGEIPAGPLSGPWKTGVGTPNPFGVLDPGTVVHEWCLDWRKREAPPSAGPAGAIPLPRRASRGGSWRHRIRWSAPGASSSLPPHFRYSDYGFRVLREGAV